MENETADFQIEDDDYYPKSHLSIFEKLWGKGFLSPGGPEEISEILSGIDLKNKRILDIGCGMGGIDLLLIQKYGAAEVVGIDVEAPVLEKAKLYALEAGLNKSIQFKLVEPGPLSFDDVSFDVVFSKDALLHISDKPMLFSEIFRVLKPEGLFVAGDWLRGEYKELSEQMALFNKLSDEEFDMVTLKDYESKLMKSGFSDIVLRDRHNWYLGVAERELKRIQGPLKDEIIETAGLQSYEDDWLLFWQVLVNTLTSGEFRPAHIKATKDP